MSHGTVNTGLAHLAGELAQGFLVHPLHSTDYLRRVVLLALEAVAARAGRRRRRSRCPSAFVVPTEVEVEFVRSQIAFYASTPSYRPVISLHGWEDVARSLSHLTASGPWDAMPGLVTDPMVHTFAVVSDVESLPKVLRARYAGLADRPTLTSPSTRSVTPACGRV